MGDQVQRLLFATFAALLLPAVPPVSRAENQMGYTLLSADFNKLYGELRIRIEIGTFGEDTLALVHGDADAKAIELAKIAQGCRDMIAMSPRIRPLLDFSLIMFVLQVNAAVAAGKAKCNPIKAESFWQ